MNQPADDADASVQVDSGDDIVCTITNTRETGRLEVVKDLIPAADPGTFDLQIDGSTEKQDAVDGDTTGEKTLNTGPHTVGELAGSAATDLDDYQKSIRCIDTANANQEVLNQPADDADASVQVDSGDDIVCTITNTRETGRLEVVKDLIPATDPGTFDLQIDGSTEKQDAVDGDTTGEKTLNTGPHTVGELAGSAATDLDDYQKAIRCIDTANANQEVLNQPADDADASVQVDSGDDIVCTITNTRETGRLEVVKDLIPATDPGTFDLQIDGSTEKQDAVDGDTTGEKTLNTGPHTVGELAGSAATDLDDYQKAIRCIDTANANQEVLNQPADDADASVQVDSGDDIVCTITNTRETGRLEVVKDLIPATDPGTFDLQIDGSDREAGRGRRRHHRREDPEHRPPHGRRARRLRRDRPRRLPEGDPLHRHRQRQPGGLEPARRRRRRERSGRLRR